MTETERIMAAYGNSSPSLFGNNNPSLFGNNNPSLFGQPPSLQGSAAPQPTVKPVTYGNAAATAPAKQKYINDLSSRYGQSGSTIYDKSTNTGFSNPNDFFKSAGVNSFDNLKFDTNYQPMSVGSQPTPSSPQTPTMGGNSPYPNPTAPQPITSPKADPYDGYKTAIQKYLDSLNPSGEVDEARTKYLDFVNNAQTGIAGLEGQGRGIPLQLVRGQQAKLGQQAELTANRLQDDVTLAQDRAGALTNRAKTEADFELGMTQLRMADEEKALARAEKTLTSTAPALLAQLGTLKDPQARDNFIRQKAQELGLSIDQVNSALQGAMPTNEPIKLGEGDALFDAATGKFITKNPKTYDPNSGSATQNGQFNLTGQQSTLLNGIINKYQASPLNQAVNRLPVLDGAIESVLSDPKNGAKQLNLVYSYVQALDTYQSAVREGELSLVSSIDSKIGQLSNAVQQVQSGQIVRPEVIQQMADAAKSISDTIKSAAQRNQQSYQSQASTFGFGDAWNAYIQGAAGTGGGGGGGENPDDIINQYLGFSSVGNTSASTGMRTDRHNNPTAFTVDVAKNAGLVLGKDYTIGDSFPNNPNLKTAKLIGDPIQQTIKVIDKIGFYTQSGKPRWTYTNAIPGTKNWANLTNQQKTNVIKQMYAHEGGTKLKQYFA